MRRITFELCAESLEACLVASKGGANRIELCSALSEDGLTPSHALIRAAVQRSGLPVYVLLRPRGGDFLYDADEFALMQDDLQHARDLGASGFALGILRANSRVDVERTRELVKLAAPLEVTFHRAFDVTPSLEEALEDVISSGCRRVLTSGGACDVVAGSASLARLVERAAGRIEVAVGGGLRLENAASVARATKAVSFHGSARRRVTVGGLSSQKEGFGEVASARHVVLVEDVRGMVSALHKA